MWRLSDERLIRVAVWLILGLGLLERTLLLTGFGFTHIGIDDALIMQVAKEYGHGIFREPYLYGQNYNPMLEALLAAPFVRMGAAPWIALPIISSALALLPFWSTALWCLHRGHGIPAMVIAAFPLVLPIEWGMMTTMPRGWVHGIALLSFIPWLQGVQRPLAKHLLTALVLAAAVLCNPNALPLAAGLGVLLLAWHRYSPLFWGMSGLAGVLGWMVHRASEAFYAAHPDLVLHPLLPSDLRFSQDLLLDGLSRSGEHFLHVHPFLNMAWVPLLLVLAGAGVFWKRGERVASIALVIPVIVLLLALGMAKVHEGCASVFFPQSRMMLSLPILLASAVASMLRGTSLPRWAGAVAVTIGAVVVGVKSMRIEDLTRRELALQDCAWVREEPIEHVQDLCARVKQAAMETNARMVVPIRWPGIRDNHEIHFQAHLICYACEALDEDFPPTYGAGYDRRSSRRNELESTGAVNVLFVGGRWGAYLNPIEPKLSRHFIEDDGLLLYTVREAAHVDTASRLVRLDALPVSEFVLVSGADDDLGR